MARRVGNVAPHEVHTTPQPHGLPTEEREDRETVRARMEAKRAGTANRSPLTRLSTREPVRTAPVPELEEAKFATPDLEPDAEPAVEPDPKTGDHGAGTRRAIVARIRDAGGTNAEVRAWAEASGIDCPARGVIPATVVDAWLADVALAREASGADEEPPAALADDAIEAMRVAAAEPFRNFAAAVREATEQHCDRAALAAEPPSDLPDLSAKYLIGTPDPADEPIPYVLTPDPAKPTSTPSDVTELLGELAEAIADDLEATDELALVLDTGTADIVRRTLERIRRHTTVTRALIDERTTPTPGDHL